MRNRFSSIGMRQNRHPGETRSTGRPKPTINSIGTRLFLGYLTMAFVTVAVLWLIQAGLMRDTYLNERIDQLSAAVASADLTESADYAILGESLQAALVVLNADGTILFRSPRLPMMGMMMRSIESVMADLAGDQVQVVEPVSGSGRFALVGRQLEDGSFLIAVFSLSDVDQAAMILRRQLVTVTVVLLAVAILLAIVLSVRLSRPIQAVTAAARELAAGHLEIQLPVRSQDEIGQLTTALNDLGQQLRQNDRLQKELIANVSHELRSPLAVIRGYAETVRDVTWPDEKKRTAQLSMIAAESARLTAVVQDILDYSRLEAGVEKIVLSSFDICPVCEQLVGRYSQKASSLGLDLRLRCQSQLVRFDRGRIDQVLNNLLDNAINHAYAGSVVEISVQPEERMAAAGTRQGSLALSEKKMVRISVHNAGPTIPPEELPRIWDRYHQAGKQGSDRLKGTGLGLSIVRSICEQHGVPYGVSSSLDQTIFWISVEQTL